MSDDSEAIAQLQYENIKLLDELNHLKEHMFSVEETLNLQCSKLSEEKKHLKSLEQHNYYLCQIMNEKDHLIDLLEQDKKKLMKINTELSTEKSSLKEELQRENIKNAQLETLKAQEEELRNVYDKLREENQKLKSELSLKCEECFSVIATVKDLSLHIKELEGEKAEFLAMRDMLLSQEKEERLKASENLECFLRKSPEWSKSQRNLHTQSEEGSSSRERIDLNLREEILEVELREKQIRIGQLENLLRRKEEEELERSQTTAELIRKLSNAGLLNYNSMIDLRLDSSAFYDIYCHLLKLLNWPEGHSGECKALTEVASLSVVVKDGVQATQPSSVRIIETISIASQTDPVKNLPPVLPFKSFEKSQSDQPPSDSDDEGEESLLSVEKRVRKGFHLFTDFKNCNLDMDIYRSCRKLSVLPEEDTDESSYRKNSLKKPSDPKFYSFHSKTPSADDITNILKLSSKPSLGGSSSYSNITSKNHKIGENNSFEFMWTDLNRRDADLKNTAEKNLVKFNVKKERNGDELSIVTPRDAIRQPRSFDSYLDPVNTQSSPLARQISDPTQHTGSTPAVTRRGSYIRKPRSTCRPLTLPCDKSERKEDRICKVRFDLNGIAFKRDDGAMEKDTDSSPVLNSFKPVKIVSRFTVEVVDEAEFRKSLEENSRNSGSNRKRPPLVHSMAYKKSVLRDTTNFGEKSEPALHDVPNNFSVESVDSPVYDTAVEDSSSESFEVDSLGSNHTNDLYPFKRRRQSDISSNSFEDSQDNSEGNDILLKSIKLHTNGDCLIMKELKKERSDSSGSNADSEIPYIDAEDLPVIKPSPDIIKLDAIPEILLSEIQHPSVATFDPGSVSEGSETFFTPSDVTPVSENSDALGPPKSSGLSKSPTVLKNLANFELLAAISESRKLMQNEIIKEEQTEEELDDKPLDYPEDKRNSEETIKAETNSSNRTSSDVSETSESDTLTYGTVKSHMTASSDCDSDTYVTVWSDRSLGFDRKFSDLSENSSSPYNTPPDTSSASFCTPPDTYSPILNSLKKLSGLSADRSLRNSSNAYLEKNSSLHSKTGTPSSSPLLLKSCRLEAENGVGSGTELERLKSSGQKNNYSVVFDSPKLEFYETNDSVQNLEAFLQTEEGLQFEAPSKKPSSPEGSCEGRFFELEAVSKAFSKQNSLESPKLLERRAKKHPPLSRQNSTEEYILLDPHDSCLNLSEEISSPSTTPDTSNKTVIFKNVPLTVSSTIDLEDDLSISETEIQVNFDGSQPEIPGAKEEIVVRYTEDVHCLSEPCTPSISSADFLDFSVPRKHRSSFTDESVVYEQPKAHLPEIIVSNLSSDSESSDFDAPDCAETDFASNISDRSEVHLSDVNSISERSDNSCSLSEHSGNAISDMSSSDSDKSDAASCDATREPSSDQTLPRDNRQLPEPSSVAPVCLNADDVLMSTRSITPDSSPDLPEVTSASDRDSDNSRDVNLNSKKFADCNLIATENKNKDDEWDVDNKRPTKENPIAKSDVETARMEAISKIVQKEESGLGLDDNFDEENSLHSKEARKPQALSPLFSLNSDSSAELENGNQTYLVAKTPLNQSDSLTNEEIRKKFQDLSFAFKTDSMTIPQRLHILKRKRDQAESNIENEVAVIKAKLKTLQYLCPNSEYVHLMTDLKKQLDFVLNAVLQLSSSAESYGYTQHEEKLLESVTIMLQHVENIESSKNDSSKISDKSKAENRRSQTAMSLDSEGIEDRRLRRRSVATVAVEGSSRRRASIATLPRLGYSTSENGNNGKGFQYTPSRPPGGAPKKLSFPQAGPRTNGNSPLGIEDFRRDSNGGRHRKDSKNSEGAMRDIEEFPERPLAMESELLEESPAVDDSSADVSDSSLHLKQLFESIEGIRRNSSSQERVTAIYCLRRAFEWSNLLINSTRFRWPETGLQYVPFYITWYVVFVLALVFMGGLFTGINGCYTYSCLKYSALWFVVPAFYSFLRRFYRFLLPLLFTSLLALTVAFLWLTEILLPQLSTEEIDSLFKTFGLEIRYLYGPPPT